MAAGGDVPPIATCTGRVETGVVPAAPLIGGRVPQVVQVAVGDGCQAFEAAVAEEVQGAGAQLARGRAGERAVERVDLGEQPDVGVDVAARERLPRSAATVGDRARGPVLVQQAGELGPPVTDWVALARKQRSKPLSAFPRSA